MLVGAEGAASRAWCRPTRTSSRAQRQIRPMTSRSFPGADSLPRGLVASGSDVVLGIATGKSQTRRRSICSNGIGWHGIFRHDPDGGRRAVEAASGHDPSGHGETGVAAPDTVMVGDSSYDMAMAQCGRRAADRRVLGLPARRGTAPRREPSPSSHSYPELLELLRRLSRHPRRFRASHAYLTRHEQILSETGSPPRTSRTRCGPRRPA